MSSERGVSTFEPWRGLFAVGLAMTGAGTFSWWATRYWAFTVDDAYITLRYSLHLATGQGPTWNPGEPPVEGYTTFLWMLLLALPHAVGLPALGWAKLGGVACGLFTLASSGWLAARMTRRLAEPALARLAAGLTVALLGATPALAVHAVSGMETCLFVFLVTSFWGLLLRRRSDPRAWRTTMLVGLLAALTRPEGNLLVAGATVLRWAAARGEARHVLRRAALAYYVLPGAIYFVARLVYYHQLLPLSFYVKTTTQPGRLPGLAEGLDFLASFLVRGGLLGLPAAVGIALTARFFWPVLVPLGALFLFFLVPAPIMAYEWRYFFPLVPVLCALAAVGTVVGSCRLLRPRSPRAAGWAPWVASALLAVVVGFCARARLERSVTDWTRYGRGLQDAHVRLARALRDVRPYVPHATVALVDVGAVAYESGWRVVDTFGLNDAFIARSGRHDPAYVFSCNPDVMVFYCQSSTVFSPYQPWEQGLHDAAVERGFNHVATYAFAPDYFLWVFAATELASRWPDAGHVPPLGAASKPPPR